MRPHGAAQALQALSRSSAARTQMARLRELLPEIEAAQAAGVRHACIVQALNAHGFALSMKSYSVMLHRLRQQRARAGGASAAAQAPLSTAQVALGTPASGAPQPPAVPQPSGPPPHRSDAGAAQAATPGQSASAQPAPGQVGQPQRFDWEALKNVPPQW